MEDLAVELYKINAIKFGDYKTKVGIYTPIYFDLRVIISFPRLMETLADLMLKKINVSKHSLVCGVPYTALPIATILSTKTNTPMVMRRKEAKSYGTKKLIEGVFSEGENCLIVEDVVTSGSSIMETVKDLRDSKIVCSDAIVLLDREQGGKSFLNENGIKMHSLLTMSELMNILSERGLISEEIKSKVERYIADNKVNSQSVFPLKNNRLKMSFSKRIQHAKNNAAKRLMEIMIEKETNLCVAADFTDATDILNLAEEIGPFICCLKTHIDIVKDFHPNFIKNLKTIAETHNFLLMEDRKFADIGKTVQLQFNEGVFEISSWAHFVTAHSLFGESILDALKDPTSNTGVFLLAEASSRGCLFDEKYTQETVNLALKCKSQIAGIVCQSPLFIEHPGFLQLTPGVQLDASGDELGQQYNSPETVVISKGGDVAVVGRGITKSSNKRKEAKKYRDLLWAAYLKRIE